jgi:uncharacterized membrane protein
MSHWKSSGLALFAAACLVGGSIGSAHAQCNPFNTQCATEWSGGSVVNLGGLSGSAGSVAQGINNAGQAVGFSIVGGVEVATEWSGSSIINLGGLLGSAGSNALAINNAGQAVGASIFVGRGNVATEWSGGIGGSIINLGGLPGSTSSFAQAINDAGQVVGVSVVGGLGVATEWSGSSIINLGGLLGSAGSNALGINNAGEVVGVSFDEGVKIATEWSGGIGGSICAEQVQRPAKGSIALGIQRRSPRWVGGVGSSGSQS